MIGEFVFCCTEFSSAYFEYFMEIDNVTENEVQIIELIAFLQTIFHFLLMQNIGYVLICVTECLPPTNNPVKLENVNNLANNNEIPR